MRPLSELEHCVLGVLHCEGPSTGYAVRRVFLDSPSSAWSGSAGSIYPLLERLADRGLVAGEAGATGRRSSTTYRLTGAGRAALRAWLREVPGPEGLIETDPVRTRLRFLTALAPEARRAAVGGMIDGLSEAVRAAERALAEGAGADGPSALVAEFALDTQRARLDWLRRNRRRIESV